MFDHVDKYLLQELSEEKNGTMEKKQRGTVKKSAAGHGKVVDKGKVGKAKTIAVKPKIKALSGKRFQNKIEKFPFFLNFNIGYFLCRIMCHQ